MGDESSHLPSLLSFPELSGEVDGRYRIISEVGMGGMGVVFRAEDRALDREVAIKVVRPDAEHPSIRERFAREARSLARVRHPQVAQVYTTGEHRGQPYFAMEYVPGPTLREWLDRRPDARVPMPLFVALMDALCRGVSAIHEAGALHRDLKPSNVIVGSGLRVVLVDFGLARKPGRSRDSSRHQSMGTPSYMAPEAINQAELLPENEHRLDVYALGLLAHEILTGERVFQGKSEYEVLAQQLMAEPEKPSERGAPEVFDAPILAALKKSPQERTQSAEALRRGLMQAAAVEKPPPPKVVLAMSDTETRLRSEAMLVDAFPRMRIISTPDYSEALEALDDAAVLLVNLTQGPLHTLEVVALARGRNPDSNLRILAVADPAEWARYLEVGTDTFVAEATPSRVLNAVKRLAYGEYS